MLISFCFLVNPIVKIIYPNIICNTYAQCYFPFNTRNSSNNPKVAAIARASAFVLFVYPISTIIRLFIVSIPLRHRFQLCSVRSVHIYVGR